MSRETFLKLLAKRLFQLPDDEISKQIEYYSEVLDDKIEDGMSEEDAVASFGDIDELAERILQDMPLKMLVKEKVKPQNGWTPLAITLAVLGSPIWISVALVAAAVLISLFVCYWAVIISIFAAVIGIGMCGIYLIVKSFTIIGLPYVLLTVGSGILLAGLCILTYLGGRVAVIWLIKLTKHTAIKIKGLFISKGDK